MAKTNNILPEGYPNYQIELIKAKLDKILENQARMERQQAERFDRLEAYVGMAESEKHKPLFFTTEQVADMLALSRNTLLNYRKSGIITPLKVRNTIRYTMDDINKLRDYLNKTT
jgi:hypothetical protein